MVSTATEQCHMMCAGDDQLALPDDLLRSGVAPCTTDAVAGLLHMRP